MKWKWRGSAVSFVLLGIATCTESNSAFGGWFAMAILGVIIFAMIPAEIGWKIALEGWDNARCVPPICYNATQVIIFMYCFV